MSYMESSYGYKKDEFDQTCSACGAVFHVIVPGQKGHEESEEYWCPECGAEYRARASSTPQVNLISPRTDGVVSGGSQPLFTSNNEASLIQGKRLAEWLEKRVSEIEANDPILFQLKKAEQEAYARIDTSQPDEIVAKQIKAHEKAVTELLDYISKRR